MSEQVENQVEVEVAQPTEIETKARTAGWVPKDEYHGDEDKWVDADEFVRRGPLFDKINAQSKELKELRKAMDQLKHHHASVKETAYKDALVTLKAQKREAFNDGDPDRILEIDDKIELVREQQRQFQHQQEQAAREAVQEELHPEFQAWTNRNAWYNTSKPMKAFADALGIELRQTGMSPSEVLRQVEAKVRDEFPKHFQNPNRAKAAAVEGSSKGTGKAADRADTDSLTSMERSIMERFVRQNIMTKEQYIAELKKTKEQQ